MRLIVYIHLRAGYAGEAGIALAVLVRVSVCLFVCPYKKKLKNY